MQVIVDKIFPHSEYDISNHISSVNCEGINKITIQTENNNDLLYTETQNTQPKTETSYVERDCILKPKGRLETVRETNSEFSCSKKAIPNSSNVFMVPPLKMYGIFFLLI